jgi:glycosyltransferase involved in cell wall biosynthesis
MNVCFATVEEFVACIYGCRNVATVLGGTWAVIPRSGDIPRAVFEADLLILSSWDERYETILRERRGPVVPRWHSTILQTELAQEAWKLSRIACLLDERAISGVAVCDPEFQRVLGRDGLVFLPDVLDRTEYGGVTPARLSGVNVSLFGAPHWRKNVLAQCAAFERARREAGASDWTLHLNGQAAFDDGYRAVLRATRIPYVDHGPLRRSEYLSLVAAMDIGLCATLCESYCYVAADHVALGVPVVASPTIACLGDGTRGTRPENVDDIADALSRGLANRQALALQQRRRLDEQAQKNADAGRSALVELAARARRWSTPRA